MITAGTRVGKYEVKRLLGQGGFGMVFVGHDTGLDRECALKFLLPEHTARPEILQRFLKEARAAAKIKHAGIVTVFECGVVEGAGAGLDGTAFIAMELLEGESLHARLARGPVPLDHAIEIARQVASALAAAHAAGIVHRDLKPDNIFLVPDPATAFGERVKVLDFGIAKLADDAGSAAKTSTHMILGTPRYMSPEQCKSSAKVDERSDVYALGCILFELVCGRPPFEGDSGELIGRHQFVPPPSARALRLDLPPALEATIAAMLAKAPEDRPASMTDVLRRLGARTTSPAVAPSSSAELAVAPTVPPTVPPDAPSVIAAKPDAGLAPTAIAPGAIAEPSAPKRVDPRTTEAIARRRPVWLFAAVGVLALAALALFVIIPASTTTPAAEVPVDARVASVADAAVPSDPDWLAKLADLQRRAWVALAAEPCGDLAPLKQEAARVSPLVERALARYECGDARRLPDPSTTYAVPVAGDLADGRPDAKVTVVMITDYASDRLVERFWTRDLRQRYGADLRIVHKLFALDPDQAMVDALAFCAAARQGKHVAIDERLNENDDGTLGVEPRGCWMNDTGCPVALGFARTLGLDVARFKTDMREHCVALVRRNTEELRRFDIRHSSGIFVNGRFITFRHPKPAERLIEAELAKAKERISAGTPSAEYYDRHVMTGVREIAGPPLIDLAKPDPLESTHVLERPRSTSFVVVQLVTIGWDWSIDTHAARWRSKSDADAIVKELLAVAARGDLDPLLAHGLTDTKGRVTVDVVEPRPRRARAEELALRLRLGEAGLVRTRSGWTFVQRVTPPPPPSNLSGPPPEAKRAAGGIRYVVLESKGGTRKARVTERVDAHVTRWRSDGVLEYSTRLRGRSDLVTVDPVTDPEIDTLDIILQLGAVGDTLRVWIPARPVIQDPATVQDVEFLEILPPK